MQKISNLFLNMLVDDTTLPGKLFHTVIIRLAKSTFSNHIERASGTIYVYSPLLTYSYEELKYSCHYYLY